MNIEKREAKNESPETGGFLGAIERIGNKLPDPAVLFIFAMLLTWVASWLLGGYEFEIPKKGGPETQEVANQLTGAALVQFLVDMVKTFTGFHPLGVVLVALLGVGVAEKSGFIDAVIKALLSVTPAMFLTPMLILVGIISHSAADAGYVLVIPLGGVIFYAAGRHPLAGIAAAFAGVSGGFSANFIPSGIDPLLQGITQVGAQILEPTQEVNPLCNYWFTTASSILIILIGWYITDRMIEPRLESTEVDGDPDDMPKMEELTAAEITGMIWGGASLLLGLGVLLILCLPEDSVFRSKGELTSFAAPLMKVIVPLIFLLFIVPGIVHGYVSGRFKSHRDVIKGMSSTMSTMGYYLVMAFFASLFIYSFNQSHLGALLAVKGADVLKSLNLPAQLTIVGIILLCAFVNLVVGSASAKWALLAPIFVPMLMQLGISPELTQAAYRVGDSSTNIITPLMPYFPLVVAFSQRYVKKAGVGTIISLMLPYSLAFLVLWTGFLLVYWGVGLPLGIGS
ncbi:MAG: AbgT family transporter [Planctomycetota bacterium]|mgnify:FL=1|nr:aminobenzoyl-glutamate transporter [Planctomycetota bacterium]MEE3052293.1 AbgT family transporter [Planctomycetota bacterium]